MTFQSNFWKGISRMVTKNGRVPGQICWLYPKISVLELQDSSRLSDVIILRRNHGIVDVLSVQQYFSTFRVQTVLTLSLLVTLCSLTRIASKFSHNSGSRWFSHERIAMKQQSRSLAKRSWEKIPILVIIDINSAFKRASRIDLTLHLLQHDSH